MSITRQNPGPRMSAAVVHNGTVYLAGQVSAEPSASTKGQTEQVLKKIDGLLAAAGTSKSKLLSATIYLSNIANFDEMNSAWDAWVEPGNTPARATVETRLANPKYLVEISVIAAV
jgi:enamine deaminase RidA (YjgF/YER057c/UK114 family)